jgi:hypothetical protein
VVAGGEVRCPHFIFPGGSAGAKEKYTMNLLSEFWHQLDDDQAVHPLDQEVLSNSAHSFKLGEPPPAFIWDIDRALVIILMSNGGWNENTKDEFLHPGNSPAEYVKRLRNSAVCAPGTISPYYAASNFSRYLADGRAAILNPYRSVQLSKEPENSCLAGVLESSRHAIDWDK